MLLRIHFKSGRPPEEIATEISKEDDKEILDNLLENIYKMHTIYFNPTNEARKIYINPANIDFIERYDDSNK